VGASKIMPRNSGMGGKGRSFYEGKGAKKIGRIICRGGGGERKKGENEIKNRGRKGGGRERTGGKREEGEKEIRKLRGGGEKWGGEGKGMLYRRTRFFLESDFFFFCGGFGVYGVCFFFIFFFFFLFFVSCSRRGGEVGVIWGGGV